MNEDVETQTSVQETQTPPELIIKKGLDKSYDMNSSFRTMGVISIVLGAIALFLLPTGGFLLGIGILYVIMGASTPLKFGERSFVFKPSVILAKKEVGYNEIAKVEYLPKRITVYYGDTKVRIDKGTFNSSDWEEINNVFKTIKK